MQWKIKKRRKGDGSGTLFLMKNIRPEWPKMLFLPPPKKKSTPLLISLGPPCSSYWYDNKPDFNRCVRHVNRDPNSFNKNKYSLGGSKFTQELLVIVLTRLAVISTT